MIEAREPYTEASVVIDDPAADGDKVAVRCERQLATDDGRSRFAVIGFFEFREGKIIRIWRNIVAGAGHD